MMGSSWFNEFGNNGGPAAEALSPKIAVLRRNLSSKLGLAIPDIDVRHLVAISLALKGVGGLLFVFGSSVGAYLLLLQLAITTPVLYDFFNYSPQKPSSGLLSDFLQQIALFGALLFFLGTKRTTAPRRQPRKKTPKPKTY